MRDLYSEVSARIVAELERGAAPWVRPWAATAGRNVPQNAVSGRPYSGSNVILLWLARNRGWATPRFYDYMLRWIAWKVQHPGELPEVAIALVGPKGTGKTTLGKTLKMIFGEHGMVARDIQQVAGRFNGHLETKCFVYADEAVWGGDKPNESALKALITDTETSYEYKGVQIFTGLNHVGLIFAGNERWIVPATIDERRFCVSQVSGEHMVPDNASREHPNRVYWDQVHQELNSGGREAFLFEMLHMQLAGWHPRVGVPRTKALGEQKLLGLREVAAWYYERLRDGVIIGSGDHDEADWAKQPLHLSPSEVTQEYCTWMHFKNPHAMVSMRWLLKELMGLGWDGGKHCRERNKTRDRFWLVPKLIDARRLFAAKIGYNPFDEEGE